MTELVSLRPALCRRDLLPPKTIELLRSFLDRSKKHDVKSMTVSLYSDGNDWQVLAGVDFIMHDIMKSSAENIVLPEDLLSTARDLTYRLMVNQYLASDFEEVDGDYVISKRSGKYSLTFFSGCAILCPYNLDLFIKTSGSEILKTPDKISSRAQLCTVILEKASSQHQRITQSKQVQDALSSWRKMFGISSEFPKHPYGFEIIDPSSEDIASCNKGFISEAAS